MNEPKAKAGTLLCIDQGEYSDYGVMGFFVVLKDFSPTDELTTYLEANPDEKESYSMREEKFLAYLLTLGVILEINYGTLHDYGSFSEFRFNPLPENK